MEARLKQSSQELAQERAKHEQLHKQNEASVAVPLSPISLLSSMEHANLITGRKSTGFSRRSSGCVQKPPKRESKRFLAAVRAKRCS